MLFEAMCSNELVLVAGPLGEGVGILLEFGQFVVATGTLGIELAMAGKFLALPSCFARNPERFRARLI